MEFKNVLPSYHKLIVCILTGLVLTASFNRLAERFIGWIVPGPVIMVITGLLLIAPIIFAVRWIVRKKKNISDDVTLLLIQGILRFGLAFDLATFGWFKIFRLQFWVPIEKLDEPFGSISNSWLTWMYFGRSYPMDFSIGVVQLIASFLLLFSRTRLIGVFIMMPVLLNVFLIDWFYDLGDVTLHAGVMLIGVIYLLFSEYRRLKAFFLLSTERLPSIKMSSLVKVLLRCSLVVVPLLFVFLRTSADRHPQLKGKYEVEKILIGSVDKTSSVNCDSVLSMVYFENGNTCIFQFKNFKQRIMGSYDYNESTSELKVHWLSPEDHHRINAAYNVERQVPNLKGLLIHNEGPYFWLSGKMGSSDIEVKLVKVK
jgi:hypothetical protein